MLPIWTILGLLALVLSFSCMAMALWSMHHSMKYMQSCVFRATFAYLVSRSVHAIAWSVVSIFFIDQFVGNESSAWLHLDSYHDAGGFRLLRHDESPNGKEDPPTEVIIMVFFGDAATVSGALWMLVLVVELIKLAKKSLDRGSFQEKWTFKRYTIVNVVIVGIYTILSFAIDGPGFWTGRYVAVLVTSNVLQALVIGTVTAGVYYLRSHSRKFESVDGQVIQSPLYLRLKRILTVYITTSLPYLIVGWFMLASDAPGNFMPRWLMGSSIVLFNASGCVFALVLVGSQECFNSCLGPSNETRLTVTQASQNTDAPLEHPVFVNTDIESSSLLWGQLGQTMHDAQELHDNLLRSLLVKHNGYEITTCGDAFQLAFHCIPDAVAYCLDVQLELMNQPWPVEFVDSGLPGSLTVSIRTKHVPLTKPKHMYLFHGIRVRMGIHAASEAEGQLFHQVHPVTHRTTYVGLSELIGREVSDVGHGGQIVVTAPIAKWLETEASKNSRWAQDHAFAVQDMGVYRISDLKIDLGIAEVVPAALRERSAHFGSIANLQSRTSYEPSESMRYGLVRSPREVAIFV
ncbi:hypothetical protein SDRG_02767 [Saprolegnia diclina VS20]|uniref:Guanylate cyclase domain-containing protein n=1 Tax=Saprolegnia diclina (strain VS20) TaxID=1156394 RepID=T0QPR9_SAPDV|nr:hypothetical protein SDRG_02767 [Saprolegnia diclina VS20]EQC40114.1 hypothetical protein SDRG_02767 [Saprolegnia diclina VS20]|eukprot:XP_008606588.1 hypothetical protein SDRG_02767 [Saprolegnia diclina VS20]